MLNNFLLMLIGFSSGIIISGGVFSLIAIIGVIPRFAQKTNTQDHIRTYEDAIIFGGIFGSLSFYVNYSFPFGDIFTAAATFLTGIFIGCVAVSLAEVLNVFPIFMERTKLTSGIPFFVLALAIGKTIGSLIYFLIPVFTN